jgi:hypothetical protein
LEYWKRAERSWPILATIARDYLAIPAASVGVERLFNQARDICSYRRHNLKPETVRALMMLTCIDRFHAREEYQQVKAVQDMEFVHIDDEDEPEISADLTGLISENDDDEEEGQNLGSQSRRLQRDDFTDSRVANQQSQGIGIARRDSILGYSRLR